MIMWDATCIKCGHKWRPDADTLEAILSEVSPLTCPKCGHVHDDDDVALEMVLE